MRSVSQSGVRAMATCSTSESGSLMSASKLFVKLFASQPIKPIQTLQVNKLQRTSIARKTTFLHAQPNHQSHNQKSLNKKYIILNNFKHN
jgi:hypothetical protein